MAEAAGKRYDVDGEGGRFLARAITARASCLSSSRNLYKKQDGRSVGGPRLVLLNSERADGRA